MVDSFRDGTVPGLIRRKGAEGDLPVPLEEKIEILLLLASDHDEETRRKALETLQGWNASELQQMLSNPSTALNVLELAADQLVGSREELIEALLENVKITDEIRDRVIARLASASGPPSADSGPQGEAAAESELSSEDALAESREEERRETLMQKISRMSVVEKIRLALTGSQSSRMILVRDPNKLVSRTVIQSPRLTESEIESYAAAKNVTEEVLRLIAMNRKAMKSYAVICALVNNPRVPIDITLPLVKRLNDRDLKALTMNRNVAEVLRATSMKMVKAKEEAKKPKMPHKH